MAGTLLPALFLCVFIFGVYPIASMIMAAKILNLVTERQFRQAGMRYAGILFLMSSLEALAFATLFSLALG